MTICLEWFVVQNLSMDAVILWLAARLASVRTGGRRILSAAVLGCGYALLAYQPWGGWLMGVVPRTAVCGGMAALVCLPRIAEWKRLLRVFAFVWVATFLLGGTGAGVMYLLGAKGYGAGAALVTAAAGGGLCLLLTVQRNRRISSRTVAVVLRCGRRRVSVEAVVDTGNVLVEPLSNLPVIVVQRDALCGLEQGQPMRCVPFTSVGGPGELMAFAPDEVRVDGRPADAVVAVYRGNLCAAGQALLPGWLAAFREGGRE